MITSEQVLELESYVTQFEREHRHAREEFMRLSQLFRDLLWYNFEVAAREWSFPWRVSNPQSTVCLHGSVFEELPLSRAESMRFPVWYEGPVCDAPALPPEILLSELRAARERCTELEKSVTAPYDWAPGGAKYNALAAMTRVGR